MPIEAAKTSPAAPDAVRAGESWRQYIDRLRSAPSFGASQLSGILAATALMGKRPDAPANAEALAELSQRLARQPSFRRVSRDPQALRLAQEGKGAEVIALVGAEKQRQQARLQQYAREPSLAAQDAAFFRQALKSMKDGFASAGAVQKEREGKLYQEMVKQLDHARTLAEKGITLDARSARELARAIQKYNDGGSKTPGGRKQASVSREAMCVLKRVMPPQEFDAYCTSINRAHQAEEPTHRRHAEPSSYTEAVLNGSAKTARQLLQASQRQLSKGMTLDACAQITAIMQLSKGNPNAVIHKDALDAEVKKLKSPGSAFLRAMSDNTARSRYMQLAARGDVLKMGRSILRDAKEHSVRAAQWQINRASAALVKDGTGASADKLAKVLAARELAASAAPGEGITNGAFEAKAAQIQKSAGFAELAARYRSDPSFRSHINEGLKRGDGGRRLEQEFAKVRNAAQTQKKPDAPEKAPEPVLHM